MHRALVLGGGNIKGAYQAGAIQSVMQAGFYPDIVCGISTGSLCGSFLVNTIGAMTSGPPTSQQWQAASQALVDFYTTRVTSPSVILKKRGPLTILWDVITGTFNGVVDTRPLRRLLGEILDPAKLDRAAVTLSVGAVDIRTGGIQYFDNHDRKIVDWVYASSAEPFTMPLVRVNGSRYVDGGLLDVAPVGTAIHLQADEIVIILCQPPHPATESIDPGDALALAGRLMEIAEAGIIDADLEQMDLVNRQVRVHGANARAALLQDYREIRYKVIRPEQEISVSAADFTAADIAAMIALGKKLGAAAMAGPWH